VHWIKRLQDVVLGDLVIILRCLLLKLHFLDDFVARGIHYEALMKCV
jgi:hypothetical protein